MNNKIRVLVDGVGGDVGQGILKSLLDTKLYIELYASCISDKSSWLYKIENSYIFPLVNDENFVAFLIDFINKHKINIYFPTVDSTLLKISKYKEFIENKTNVKIFIDNLEKVKICDDKYLTNKFLIENGFYAPKTISMDGLNLNEFLLKNKYPLILKTKSGNGAKNVIKVNNYEELKPFISNSSWLLQEFLNIENEITSGIYIGNDREVKGIYVLKRTLKSGSTHHAERIIDKNLEKQLIDIAKKMDMQYLNIQAVYEDNKVLPFEFNGRLSGTTGAMRQIFNVPEMFIRENILNEYIKPSNNNEKIFFTRYNEEIIYTQNDIDNLKTRS
ncbi:ATP-grasp domain-containing protein [Aliarcobacter butzleri]|uniref:ATP-grasp domain-containing protein n=1 Tax=Aliarcobacter butzleri TaxID=28197 RepID=UPI001EDA6F22|nr:ATP-grasp domain-containing protein [Aliarcobacter butzleri]MCG3677057.1 ATP-grasp domain-containing protein [Aliarcobacter butzleri]